MRSTPYLAATGVHPEDMRRPRTPDLPGRTYTMPGPHVAARWPPCPKQWGRDPCCMLRLLRGIAAAVSSVNQITSLAALSERLERSERLPIFGASSYA